MRLRLDVVRKQFAQPVGFHRGGQRQNGVYFLVLAFHFADFRGDKKVGVLHHAFTREDAAMASLFERFLLNFYRREQTAFRVRSETLQWQATFGDLRDLEYLPMMRTDVSLESPARKIVIDAK